MDVWGFLGWFLVGSICFLFGCGVVAVGIMLIRAGLSASANSEKKGGQG